LTRWQYDDIGLTGQVGQPPALTSDGGVVYNNFMYRTFGTPLPQLAGVRPVSTPNTAILLRSEQGSIATTGRCFILKSTFFGCVVMNVQSAAPLPISCKLIVVAYGNQNQPLGTRESTYTPNDPVLADAQLANLDPPPAKSVTVNATILDLGDIGGVLTALLFDKTIYT
jgi:hypothetical protein